ncbi:DUF2244 domain-containing protein [Aquabacter sp. CN5-332]|uniref:DUF2244 domain-containing protein n=1 Tax=Aquabacter sp. CN5-332 TaxID=3156608 RepID=UPI0032B39545
MTKANDLPFPDDGEPTVFATVMAPHRSLSPRGFFIFMLAIGGLSFACGIMFLSMGAWPIFGFFGLDVALLYFAFRANFRAAAAREYIRITPSLVQVRQVSAQGKARNAEMNPFFTRVSRRDVEELGTLDLSLVSRGNQTPVGIHLGPWQKSELADDLSAALGKVKRGVTRTMF